VAGSLFIALLSQLSIKTPFSPVPITGQTLAVLLVGAVLGSKRAAISVALYLVEGCVGLPFFAAAATAVTAGYLVGFVFAAYCVGYLAERGWDQKLKTAIPIFILGQAIIYLFGASWLALAMHSVLGWKGAVFAGIVPFLLGDAVKILVASSTLPFAWKWVNRSA
jgi:biotin transporter BioY